MREWDSGFPQRRCVMPRGDKSKYTDKQKRKAEHIEDSYESRGVSEKEAERRAWATVNKETGGGNKSGSGRGVPDTHVASKRGGRIGRAPRGQGHGEGAGARAVGPPNKTAAPPQAQHPDKSAGRPPAGT